MTSIARLCTRAILLEESKLVMEGPTLDVIEKYIGLRKNIGPKIAWESPDKSPGDSYVKLKSVRLFSAQGESVSELDISKDFFVEFSYWNLVEGSKLLTFVRLVNNDGTAVLTAANLPSICLESDPWYDRPNPKGLFRSVCRIPGNLLKEGYYFVNIIIGDLVGNISSHVYEEQIISFEIVDKKGMEKEHSSELVGVVQPKLDWKTDYLGR